MLPTDESLIFQCLCIALFPACKTRALHTTLLWHFSQSFILNFPHHFRVNILNTISVHVYYLSHESIIKNWRKTPFHSLKVDTFLCKLKFVHGSTFLSIHFQCYLWFANVVQLVKVMKSDTYESVNNDYMIDKKNASANRNHPPFSWMNQTVGKTWQISQLWLNFIFQDIEVLSPRNYTPRSSKNSMSMVKLPNFVSRSST